MGDFIRSLHGSIIGVVVFLIVVWTVRWVILKVNNDGQHDEKNDIAAATKKMVNYITVLTVIASIVYVFIFASVNETPRKVIDRSSVNNQADSFEQRNSN